MRRAASVPRSSATPRADRCARCSQPPTPIARARSSCTAATRAGSGPMTTRGRRLGRIASPTARIPGARFVELPGDVHVPWLNFEQILEPIEEFLTGVRPSRAGDRVLATILFTDIVGSTDRARELGDAAWARLLRHHHDAVRRLLPLHGGTEVDVAGDGFLALFDGPARAIRCGLAIRDAVRALGLETRVAIQDLGEHELKGIAGRRRVYAAS